MEKDEIEKEIIKILVKAGYMKKCQLLHKLEIRCNVDEVMEIDVGFYVI